MSFQDDVINQVTHSLMITARDRNTDNETRVEAAKRVRAVKDAQATLELAVSEAVAMEDYLSADPLAEHELSGTPQSRLEDELSDRAPEHGAYPDEHDAYPDDCYDEGEALASAGFGTDEDYGSY